MLKRFKNIFANTEYLILFVISHNIIVYKRNVYIHFSHTTQPGFIYPSENTVHFRSFLISQSAPL